MKYKIKIIINIEGQEKLVLQLNTHLVNQEEEEEEEDNEEMNDYDSSIDDEIKRIDDYYYLNKNNNQQSNKSDDQRAQLSDSNSISSRSIYKNISIKSDINVVEPRVIIGKITSS